MLAFDLRSVDTSRLGPGVERAGQELQFVSEQGPELEMSLSLGLEGEGEVDTVGAQKFEGVGSVARFDVDDAMGKAFLKFTQDRGEDVLAGSGTGAETQPAMAPFAKLTEAFAGGGHFGEDFFGVF